MDDDDVLPQPAYKTVELRFGDAAVTLHGDGSLGGDLEAFTAALTTINPAADDVVYAVGWLVARSELWVKAVKKMEEIAEAVRLPNEVAHVDPDPGDADPVAPAEEMFPEGKAVHARLPGRTPWDQLAPEDKAEWQSVAEARLSERATHDAAHQRVVRDYNA